MRAAQELRVGVGRLRRRFREVTDRRELTPSQVSVLSRLWKEGPSTASGIAAAERVRPQSAASWLGARRLSIAWGCWTRRLPASCW